MSRVSRILAYTPNTVKAAKAGILSLGVLALLLNTVQPSSATSITHNSVVSANPADYTPNIKEGAVYKMHQNGNIIYAGGTFKTAKHKKTTYNRSNFIAFSALNGTPTSFAPKFDGAVWAMAQDGNNLYVGGDFKNVDSKPMRGVAKFNLSTGRLDTKFKSPLAWGKVSELAVARGRLIIAGTFKEKLMSADLTTGKKNTYINLPITGTVTPGHDGSRVYRFSINPAGNRLIAIGDFTHVNGVKRYRAFMLNLGANVVTLNGWYYAPLEDMCASTGTPHYLRDVDFSPDGKYFVIVASGFVAKSGRVGVSLCDVAAKFDTKIINPSRPVWINHSGGDTFHSVAISGKAVYVQGHFRRLDNPKGKDTAGPGAVSRPGIGAIDPVSGKALSWNPGKERGVGGKDTLITPQGLWIGSDTSQVAGEWRQRIAFFPL